MVSRSSLIQTVVAEDVGFLVGILWRHGLRLDMPFQALELRRHVLDRFGAYRTLVRNRTQLLEAAGMNAVPASHERNRRGAVEEILATDRTIAFGRVLDTAMLVLEANAHASGAGLAVEIILANTLANPTEAAIVAVIDGLSGVVVP
jgi:hypothetical protein